MRSIGATRQAPSPWLTAAATAVTMVAFASNSLLCRLALEATAIDAVTFTVVRVVSGALTLLIVLRLSGRRHPGSHGTWASAIALFAYAIGFSLAYVRLDAGTGALILFGCVQLTMIAHGLLAGERPAASVWVGLAVAASGLVVLVAPGLTAPAPLGAALMALAGVSWGLYSLYGRSANDPLASTTGNFVRAVPLVLVAGLAAGLFGDAGLRADTQGLLLALASGSLASALGYVLWYTALRGLTATRAATVQLTVPVIAAAGGVLLLSEAVSGRLIVAGVLVLAGVGAALRGRIGLRS